MRNLIALLIVVVLPEFSRLSAQSAADPLELTLHHATASVGDLNRAVKWYEEKLGFKMALRRQLNADSEIAWMTMPGNRVDLIQSKGSSKAPAAKDHLLTEGWAHVVFHVADADRAYAVLKARGVFLPETVSTNTTLRIKTCHFPDSEGNWLEIYQDMGPQTEPKK